MGLQVLFMKYGGIIDVVCWMIKLQWNKDI